MFRVHGRTFCVHGGAWGQETISLYNVLWEGVGDWVGESHVCHALWTQGDFGWGCLDAVA